MLLSIAVVVIEVMVEGGNGVVDKVSDYNAEDLEFKSRRVCDGVVPLKNGNRLWCCTVLIDRRLFI